jgi:hypothetical protein
VPVKYTEMTLNNKYLSKYSNGKPVSSAQYITELICERKAIKDKKDLHYRFWLSKEWSVFFRNQIASANKLLKKYSDKAIVNALLTDKGKNIYSLRAPHLPPMIETEQHKLDSLNQSLSKNFDRKQNATYAKNPIVKKNIISKLKDLDNDS